MKVMLVLVSLVALVGCGAATETASQRPEALRVFHGPVDGPTISPIAEPLPGSNAEAVAKAQELFAGWGLVEAEPPHGSQSAVMWGRWGERTLLASVVPSGVAANDGDVIDSYEIGGVVVETIQQTGQQVLVRFAHGGFVIHVAVLMKDQLEPDLEQTRALVDGLLCPSECGGLPDGADG